MHAVRYRNAAGEIRLGRLEGETIVDAGSAGPQGFVPSVEGWALIAAASGPTSAAADVQLLHPVVPSKVIAIGLNYRDHAKESELDIPAMPVVFSKFSTSLIGHGESIVIPREETRPDFEGELAVIIGKRTHRATLDDALSAIGGITCVHDVSGRRAQLETPLRQFDYGKSFDTFCPLGPLVPASEVPDPQNLAIETILNGTTVQRANTSLMVFGVRFLVAELSRGMTLLAGTVVLTGTPAGVGAGRKPPLFLKDGDLIEVKIERVGHLKNRVREA